jgi:peptidoglycan/LPS O-acetylase OafA/YrhL
MKHNLLLDGMRGWAIIFVMIYHFSIPFQQAIPVNDFDLLIGKIFQMGWLGVDLFFVMSGFLITTILYNSTENKGYFKNFYVRRFLRIFPLYYGVLFLLLVALPFVSDSFSQKTQVMQDNSIWFWTYLVNWRVAALGDFRGFQSGYMWSLAVEEQFYIFWPLVVYFFKKHLIKISLFFIIFSFILKLILLQLGVSAVSLYTMTFTHLDGLLLGGIIAVLSCNGQLNQKYKKLLFVMTVIATAIFILIILKDMSFIFYHKSVAFLGISALSVIFCYMLTKTISAKDSSLYYKLFSYKPIIKCGQLCYGLYLLHQPIGVLVSEKLISHTSFFVFESYAPAAVLNIVICTMISLTAAQLSYSLYEVHFLKLKKYFI